MLLCLPLLSCNRDSWLKPFGFDRARVLKKYTPQDDEALAQHYVDLLLQERFDEIENGLDPSIKNRDTHNTLSGMAYLFPSKPISVRTVDAVVVRGRDSSTSSITLEYEFARSWLLAQVSIRTRDGVKTITGFSVNPIPEPVEAMNEFTLDDKGFSQYAGLFLAMCVSIPTVYAFVLCVRAKIGRKKWVWLVTILIGVFRFTVNWTTGQCFFTSFAVQAPPVMATSSLYGPWMLQIAAPLGAIAFLRLRIRLASGALPLPEVPKTGREDEGSAFN